MVTTLLSASLPLSALAASSHKHHPAGSPEHVATHARHGGSSHAVAEFSRGSRGHWHRGFGGRVARGGGGIQCVTFARAATGIELSGNAADWWDNAAGLYQRGNRPEVGSVLNFRANGRMRMGHVAVVTAVNDSRSVEIDHANWSGPGAVRGGVSRAITVVDVSPDNDWSAVRVELGHSADYGSVYPTYGFIYDRPDGTPGATTTMVARAAPLPALNPPPADLRPGAQRVAGRLSRRRFDEVAEAPAPKQLELDFGPTDAPNRNLR